MWLAFTLIFAGEVAFNVVEMFGRPPHFDYQWAPDAANLVVVPATAFQPAKYLSGEFKDFVERFNRFEDEQANDAHVANLWAARANLIGLITAVVAMFAEWRATNEAGHARAKNAPPTT
jgi:hypothetical protein